jgi:hypothetical protein
MSEAFEAAGEVLRDADSHPKSRAEIIAGRIIAAARCGKRGSVGLRVACTCRAAN